MKSSDKSMEKSLRQVVVLFTTVTVLFCSFAFASSASASDTRSCSEGGLCIIGDIGPGGGTVFFVKSAGAFEASKTVSRVEYGFEDSDTVGVSLTEEEQGALSFDYLEIAPYTAVVVRKWANVASWTSSATIDTRIGSGANGTQAITTAYGSQDATNNAAHYASSYLNNGLDDWFLPSQDELALVTILHFDDALGLNNPISEDISRGFYSANGAFYGWTTTPTNGVSDGAAIKIDPQWLKGAGLSAGADASVLPIRSFSFQALPQVPAPDNSSGGGSAPQVIPEPVVIPEPAVVAVIPVKPQKLRFGIGQTSFTSSQRSVIKAIASEAEEDSSFVVTGGVGYLPGPSRIDMLALASQRAMVIKQELVKAGVGKSRIQIKTRIFDQGKKVKTKVRVIPAASQQALG